MYTQYLNRSCRMNDRFLIISIGLVTVDFPNTLLYYYYLVIIIASHFSAYFSGMSVFPACCTVVTKVTYRTHIPMIPAHHFHITWLSLSHLITSKHITRISPHNTSHPYHVASFSHYITFHAILNYVLVLYNYIMACHPSIKGQRCPNISVTSLSESQMSLHFPLRPAILGL